MIAAERAAKWLYQRLATDTGAGGVSTLVGGRIYRDLAPQNAALPAVVFNSESSIPVNGNGGARIMGNQLWLVKVIGEGDSYATIRPVADRVDARLHGQSGVQDDAIIDGCILESEPPQPSNVENGKRYVYLLQLFRVVVHPS